MKGCTVCGSAEEHFDGSDCVGHLKTEIRRLNKELTLSEDRYHAKRREVRNVEFRLRDAEARVVILPSDKEVEQVASDECQQDWNRLEYKEIYRDGFLSGAKWLREEALHTPTTGAFDRLRDQVLEEAAKIAENSCLSPPDGGSPTDQEIESADYAARLIRAAKKVEQ